MALLERAAPLASITEQLAAVGTAGRLVLISGEAGVGKSALVSAFCAEHGDGHRVLVGHCDDLFAPRPLGPFADMARTCGGDLRAALLGDDRTTAFEAFLDELAAGSVIAVVEDLQWADEATLDLVRFVTRRLPRLPCLLIATYRDDLDRDHPLRLTLGDLVPPTVSRIHLDALSAGAVRMMAAGSTIDPEALHAATGGNPFFITEVLAAEGGTVPPTVRDAVLTRAGRLHHDARDVLDAAAVLGTRTRHDLVLAVAERDSDALDECLARGFLHDDAGQVGFRHDLARLAIDGAITPWRRRLLHGRALAALGGDHDIVRRAHHAIAAGDTTAMLELAPGAAAQCSALGAHREAATLLGPVVVHADQLPPEERVALLEARARSCQRVDLVAEARAAGAEVLAHRRAIGDDLELARWLMWLAIVHRDAGQPDASLGVITEAITLLAPRGESVDLARALATLAQHHMVHKAGFEAVDIGEQALAMAERCGAEDVIVHALNTVGTARGYLGDDVGVEMLRESRARARAAGLEYDEARADNNLQCLLVFGYSPREAARCFEEGFALPADREMRFFEQCMLADHATTLVMLGRWDEAAEHSRVVLSQTGTANVHRVNALVAIGRMRARRGDPDPFGPLDEARRLATPYCELQLDHPIRVAIAEAAWLTGDPERAGREATAAVAATPVDTSPWFGGEIALLCRRSGVAADPRHPVAEPFALHLTGRHREAAAAWHDRGCPYEEADTLGDSGDETDLRRSLELLQAIGARPRAGQVARRLRELGARSLPRGPRPATQANPAGLTARELDVLALLSEGLRNADIADRLVVSPKTVDHHVSAILSKLAVDNRRDAVRAAESFGLRDGGLRAARWG